MAIKGPVIPKKIELIGRVPWYDPDRSGQVVPTGEEFQNMNTRVYVPGTDILSSIALWAYNNSLKKSMEGFEKWKKSISPSEPSGSAPAPSKSGDDEAVNNMLYDIVKDKAVSEGYRFMEVSPEEMLNRYGYASDRRLKDRGCAGNYKGWQEGKTLYVSEFDPKVAAHEYMGAIYESMGRKHADHEEEIDMGARALLKSLSKQLKNYSLN